MTTTTKKSEDEELAELRALNDPWVDYFLDEQEYVSGEMLSREIGHMAESFGRPGSETRSGQKYRALSFEFDMLKLHLGLYCLAKGYTSVDEIALPDGDPPEPRRRR